MNSTSKYQVISMTEEHVEAVAKIHLQELPSSILSRLGYCFLKDFYYKGLFHLKDFVGFVLIYENQAAGFIGLSLNPNGIFKELIVQNPLKLVSVLIRSIFRDIKILKACFQAGAFILKPKSGAYPKDVSEVLSFAVLEQFRSLEFYRASKLKLANKLFQFAIDRHKESRFKKTFLMVETKNAAARIFYRNMGFVETDSQNYFDLDCIRCEKTLTPPLSSSNP